MINITKKEENIYNQIKLLQIEYPMGVSFGTLRMDLNITEHELQEILDLLKTKNIIQIEEGKIKTIHNNKEINALKNKKEVKQADLNNREEKALKIIHSKLNNDNQISKYILEGELLYGELGLNRSQTYNLIVTLKNKGLIKKVAAPKEQFYEIN